MEDATTFGEENKLFCCLWNSHHKTKITALSIIYSFDNTNKDICISGSEDGICKSWDISQEKCLKTFVVNRQNRQAISSICSISDFKGKKNRCIIIASGRLCKIWDIKTGQCIQTIRGNTLLKNYHTSDIMSVCMTFDNTKCITVANSECKLWDLLESKTGLCLSTWPGKFIYIYKYQKYIYIYIYINIFVFITKIYIY